MPGVHDVLGKLVDLLLCLLFTLLEKPLLGFEHLVLLLKLGEILKGRRQAEVLDLGLIEIL